LFDRATYGNVQFISNDEIVLTISRGLEHDRIENAGFYRLNIRTGALTEIYDGSIYGFGNSIGTDVGGGGRSKITFDTKGIRYVTTSVDHAPLIHVSYKDAAVTFLTKDRLTVQEYIPYHDGYLVVGLLDQYGSEIYQVDKSGKPRALTAINKSLFDGHRITVPQEIIWTNGEGRKLNGWVLPPANYKKGESYPAILSIHGGPKTAYGTVFFHEMQYWANQGYAVFYTNPRGSDGRGSEFADIRGRFGEVDYEDLMLFTDAVLSQVDFIDSTRLGVTGGSYGGVMTNWIIGHTDRFKAAAALRSISSWLTFGTTSDIGHTFTYNYWGTDLWRNGKKLWEGSPLKYADRVKTPTLFLHSEEDYRCWLVEGIQMYYALQYFGVPTRLVVFTDENHDLSRNGKPLNRIRRLEELTLWFKTYLNP
jgi:dipeptidyl aminopeptidase/acylaminoacyl peptidase